MTRETKVGIAVSCTFACLVGAVAMQKLRGGSDGPTASGTSPTAVAQAHAGQALPADVGRDKGVSAASGLAPKSEAKVTPGSGRSNPMPFDPTLVRATPPEVKPIEATPIVKPVEVPPSVKPVESPPVVKPVEVPPEVKPVEAPPEVKPVEAAPTTVKPVEVAPIVRPIEPPPEVKPIEPSPSVKPVEVPPSVKPVEPPPVVKPVEAPPEVKPVEAAPTTVKPVEVAPIVRPIEPPPEVKPIEPSPIVKPSDPTGPVPTARVMGATLTTGDARLTPTLEPGPIAVGRPGEGPGTRLTPTPDGSSTTPVTAIPVGPTTIPEATLPVTPSVLASVQSTPLPAESDAVVSYSETEYVCEEKDTLKSVSARFYQTEGYAEALKQWNLNHRKQPTAVRNDGSLAPREKVYLPSTAELERRYPEALPGQKPASGQARPTSSGTVQAGYTMPAPPVYYKVVQEEMMGAIAKRTLGNVERWGEIHQLNPSLETMKPLPAGTVLVMPTGAEVPPENAYTLKKE
jgi:hypothetical protein